MYIQNDAMSTHMYPGLFIISSSKWGESMSAQHACASAPQIRPKIGYKRARLAQINRLIPKAQSSLHRIVVLDEEYLVLSNIGSLY